MQDSELRVREAERVGAGIARFQERYIQISR